MDGVLNTIKSKSLFALSKPKLRQLSRIVNETECKIVLSSSWRRYDYAYQRLKRRLKYRNLYIHDITPTINEIGSSRGYEIQKWLDENSEFWNVEKYCIVDDINDMLTHQSIYFVQTNDADGLTKEKADEIIYILS